MRTALRRSLSATLVVVMALSGSLLAASPATASATQQTDTGTSTLPVDEAVYYWNDVLLEAFRLQGGGPGPLARVAAMMHVGIFDVLNSLEWAREPGQRSRFEGYLGVFPTVPHLDEDLAVGIVARDLLIHALPEQGAHVQQAFAERHANDADADAEALAGAVADAMIATRANDGSDDDTPYPFESVPGSWQLTGHACNDPILDPVTPNWGRVTPFAIDSSDHFRQQPVASDYEALLASSIYADHLDEVRRLGRYDSTERTAEQEEIAWFWANDLDGTYKPPGQLLEHAELVARDAGVSPSIHIARHFAYTSLALADAGIAAWDQKYETSIDLWRPQTAIQQTGIDPDWLPLSADENDIRFNPCFPAWVSGHATFAAAWAGIMRNLYGNEFTFTATTEDPHAVGVTRQFTSFTEAAEENARSRIYLGVHYQFDADDGLDTGYSVADHVFDNYLAAVPEDLAPFFLASCQGSINNSWTCLFEGFVSDSDTIVSWHWDFGDGRSGSGQTTLHLYPQTGVYNVTLTVTDDAGRTGSVTRQVAVGVAIE